MKIKLFDLISILFISVASVSAQNTPGNVSPSKLEYHLSWDGKSPLLHVDVIYTPSTKDSTVFILGDPGFGGQADLFKVVQQIKCDASDSYKTTPSANKVVIRHAGAGVKKLSYTINGAITGKPERAVYNELFRPVITPGSLYILPLLFMLEPQNTAATSLSIQWHSAPKNMTYFMSAAPGTAPLKKQVIDMQHKDDFVMLMGDDLVINNYKVHGIPYYMITSKKDTVNNMQSAIAPFFTSYFPHLRDIWKDDSCVNYYVSLLPLKSALKPLQGGFNWASGFIMKYSGPFDEQKKRVLAHETSHSWIGNFITIGQNSFDDQWFGEGFNDYICNLALLRSGIDSAKGFVHYVNDENLAKHYSSPVKNAPNDSIAARYWKDKNYEKLPYHRGFIFAFYLDNQIRLASGGKQSLRDLLLVLFKRAKVIKAADSDKNITLKDFLDATSLFLPPAQVQHDVDTYMLKGTPIDFSQVKLIADFNMTIQNGIPVLGLNAGSDLHDFCNW